MKKTNDQTSLLDSLQASPPPIQTQTKPKIYSLYNRPLHPGVSNFGPSLAQQSMKDECDVNLIIKKYGINAFQAPEGFYGDYSSLPDFREAQEIILDANAKFAALPSNVREFFKNEPAIFLEFASNPANKPELKRLGLVLESPTPPETVEDVLRRIEQRLPTPPVTPDPKTQPKGS